MGMLYRCDRPGCGNEKAFKMNFTNLTVRGGTSTYILDTYLCDDCWMEFKSQQSELENRFYHGLGDKLEKK